MKFKVTIISLITFISLSIIPGNVFAAKSSYSEAVSVDPVSLAFDKIYFQYEKQLTSINSFTGFVPLYTSKDWFGIGVGGSYRWYMDLFKTRQKAIEGFSIGPRAIISYFSWSGKADAFEGGVAMSIGGEACFKWIIRDFVIEAGLLLDFYLFEPEGTESLSALQPFGFRVGLGYAW